MFLLVFGLILIGAAVALGARAVVLPRMRAVERLSRIGSYGYPSPDGTAVARHPLADILERLADRLGAALLPSVRSEEQEELRTLLAAAGMYRTSPVTFLGYRALAVLGLMLLWLWLAPAAGAHATLLFLGLVIMGLSGWVFPSRILRDRAQRRLARIDHELPELIDALVVTVEAGMAFSGALQMAGREIHGPLGDEIDLALQEQAMGLSTEAALENMLKRTDTPAMRSFVRSVLQGENLGVSIGDIMRGLAVEMRSRRRSAAEERAHKAPVKMLFPLVLLIFPAIFIVLLYPAVYELHRTLGGG